ncbi:MAG: cytidylate kinase family protein, partial [Gammaproteobacteria bacterium]|nr:cytidylate kinase family protein [Gammaproteobacteria bacterium]
LYTAEEVINLAAKGDVLIRGWGATYVLGPVSHVVCVRVCAPLQFRAANLMRRIGVDDERLARKEVEKNDAAHGRTMRQLFDVDWRNPLLYDLVLNTAKIPVDDCVATIAGLTRRSVYEETEQSRAQLADLQLEARIRTALKDDPRTQDAGQFFDIVLEHTTGKVKLVGVVHSEAFKEEVEEIAAGVEGVTEIDNQLTVAVLTSV